MLLVECLGNTPIEHSSPQRPVRTSEYRPLIVWVERRADHLGNCGDSLGQRIYPDPPT